MNSGIYQPGQKGSFVSSGMKFIKGQNRAQTTLFPVSLDDVINTEKEVSIIDLFIDSLYLSEFGFKVDHTENGRPAYHLSDMLKLYIYGYLNKVSSSRDLEKECKRNIEVMWLLKCLKPDHNTISNFSRDNPKAIKKVFRKTISIAKHFNLTGGTLFAGNSTKLRAQNSKKYNFKQKKTDRHLEYIERAEADFGVILIAYNLRRIINIVGMKNWENTRKVFFILYASNSVILSYF